MSQPSLVKDETTKPLPIRQSTNGALNFLRSDALLEEYTAKCEQMAAKLAEVNKLGLETVELKVVLMSQGRL